MNNNKNPQVVSFTYLNNPIRFSINGGVGWIDIVEADLTRGIAEFTLIVKK